MLSIFLFLPSLVKQSAISPLIKPLAQAYRKIYKDQKREFFGLRDFYSLVKMVYSKSAASGKPPTWPEIEEAVRRNFGGHDEETPVKIFRELLATSCILADDSKY